MFRFMALFERKEKSELAKRVKKGADAQRIRDSPTLKSPTVTLGSVTIINPIYSGPNPYRGPEATDPQNAGKLFIPIRNAKPLKMQSRPPPRPRLPSKQWNWRNCSSTIIEESDDSSNPFMDAEASGETPSITYTIDPILEPMEAMCNVTAECTPKYYISSQMRVPRHGEIIDPFAKGAPGGVFQG